VCNECPSPVKWVESVFRFAKSREVGKPLEFGFDAALTISLRELAAAEPVIAGSIASRFSLCEKP
jgi:hypothetical protein